MFIIHPGADLCQRPGLFHKPKAAGNPAAFLHRETLLRREFLNPCRLRHTSPIPSSLWPAATTGLRRTPAGGISASLKCGRNLRFPHKRPFPGTCSLFSFHFAKLGHINQGIPLSFCGSPENRPPQARQRTAPRRGQAEPGRSLRTPPSQKTRQGHKNQGIPAQFLWDARELLPAGVKQAGA